MNCQCCNNICVKRGVRKSIQRWFCKLCSKWQQECYQNDKVTQEKILYIIEHNNEGNSISSIARLMSLSKATVQRIIMKYGSSLRKPEVNERDEEYEIDELCTYVGKKDNLIWITYAINKWTRQVIDLIVGARDSENISL